MGASLLSLVALVLLAGTAESAGSTSNPSTNPLCITLGTPTSALDLHGPSFYLSGDGTILVDAFKEHISQVSRSAVNVVVLAGSSGSTPTPECDVITSLGSSYVGSCTTCTMPVASDANSPEVQAAIDDAQVVFFSGGDQCRYVNWRNSSLFTAVQDVVQRGGGVGGGSAGLAIEGSAVYTACDGGVYPDEALEDPYNQYMTFTTDYFKWTHLENTITDTHFYQRDRMGRLMSFVARQREDQQTSNYLGIGVDEDSVLLMDRTGLAEVYGNSSSFAYIVLADHTPEVLREGEPLTYSDFKLWKLRFRDTFDFQDRPRSGYYSVSVDHGRLTSDPY